MFGKLTAMDEIRFTISDCLHFKIFKVDKLLGMLSLQLQAS